MQIRAFVFNKSLIELAEKVECSPMVGLFSTWLKRSVGLLKPHVVLSFVIVDHQTDDHVDKIRREWLF